MKDSQIKYLYLIKTLATTNKYTKNASLNFFHTLNTCESRPKFCSRCRGLVSARARQRLLGLFVHIHFWVRGAFTFVPPRAGARLVTYTRVRSLSLYAGRELRPSWFLYDIIPSRSPEVSLSFGPFFPASRGFSRAY